MFCSQLLTAPGWFVIQVSTAPWCGVAVGFSPSTPRQAFSFIQSFLRGSAHGCVLQFITLREEGMQGDQEVCWSAPGLAGTGLLTKFAGHGSCQWQSCRLLNS